MLKKELEEQLNAANTLIASMRAGAEVDRDLIKSAANREGRHTKLRRHVDKALCAIDAIRATSCRGELDEKQRHYIYENAERSDKPQPDLPPLSELYVTLGHIEEILSRPVEEAKKDTRFGY